MASVLGWSGWKNLDRIKNYYQIKQIFPKKPSANEIIDGDTLIRLTIRLLGIDASNRGEEKYQEAKEYLSYLILFNLK